MSAFIVGTKTLNLLVHAIMKAEESDLDPALVALRKSGAEQVGSVLLAMNVSAVNMRYNETSYFPTFVLQPPSGDEATPAHVYTALSCFIYQCSEGSVPEWPLFKAVEKLSDQYKNHDFVVGFWGE